MTGQEEAHEAQRENAELKLRIAELEAQLAAKQEDQPAGAFDSYMQTR